MIDWGARIYGHVYGAGRGDPPWDLESWSLFEQHAGKRVSILSYGQPFGNVSELPLRNCEAKGVLPLITVMTEGTSIDAIRKGQADSQIDQMAKMLQGRGRVVLRFAHEMNGTWYSYGYGHVQPLDYQRAFRRVYKRMQVASNVDLCWCPNVIGGKTVDDPHNWWPGAGYVDVVGVDGYNQTGLVNTNVFEPTMDALSQFIRKKPMWICETGCVDNFGKGQWLERLLNKDVRQLGFDAMVYFNGDPIENGQRRTWPIESGFSATQGFRNGIASAYYKGALV